MNGAGQSFTFWSAVIAVAVALVAVVGLVLALRSLHRMRTGWSGLEAENARLQNQLHQARRMEAVGLLAGSIVHNLNNLLAVILGHTRMAMHDLPQQAGVQEELERVTKAGHMASDLVKEISDFFRQADQARKPTDLVPVVRDTLKLLRDILPANVEIRTNLAPSCGPVLATATGVQQILMNLCSNSVQAIARNQGAIDVSLGEEKVKGWHRAFPQELGPGTYLKLSVQDDGCGMDPATLDRIFDSYYTDADNGSKMGIGLSTVTRILADHDGVTVPQSQVGRGTRFDVYFPLIAWSVEAPALIEKPVTVAGLDGHRVVEGHREPMSTTARLRAEAKATGETRATVLLVDDEEMVAQVTTRGLQRMGFRVITHTDSRKALADFVQTPDVFDVVITDQIMPHMSGVRLTRKIRDVRPDIPIILITGFRDSFNELQAREAGVLEFVLKPTSYRDLADLIERVLLRRMEGHT